MGLGGGFPGRKRRQNEANILGVFASGGGEDPPRRVKDGKRGKSPPKAVAFVRGEVVQKTEVPPPAPKVEEEGTAGSSGDEVDPRFRFEGAPNAPPAPELGPKLPARNKLTFGQMGEKYGKGFAMLQKMGFDGGGLGAHRDGIANPIEVTKRKERQALQDEGEMLGQDLYGQEPAVEQFLGKKGRKQDGPKPSEGWKRDTGAKGPKIEYRTAAEVAKEPVKMRIVDMRGPEVKVASSFSELAASLSDPVRSLKELRYNTRRLVAQYEDRIRTFTERKKYYEDALLSAAAEHERLEAAAALGLRGAQKCRELAAEMEGLRDALGRGELGLRDLGIALGSLQRERPMEFQALRAPEAALSLGVAAASRELASWRPLEEPEDGLSPLAPWVHLSAASASGGGGARGGSRRLLDDLCAVALLPRLRAALCSWSAREPEPCLRLIERCRAALLPEVAEEVAAQLVLPRLRAEVDAWNPRVDRTSAHLWVHPWLPVLGSRLDCLWAPIRFKLSSNLDRWDPSDPSAVEVVKPWRLVFDPANWEPLIEKVLLRLQQSVGDVAVRPDGQDIKPIQDLLSWVGVAPNMGLARVLETAFFPQWQKALRDWLRAPTCDFNEVLQWYQGWKALFPEALREQGSVQRQLAQGLEVMKHFMGSGGATAEESAPPTPPSTAGAPEATRQATSAPPDEVSLSLGDYLAEVAGEHGLVFLPKKADHYGKQVYQFGAASIYLERNLVYAAPKSGVGEWRPVNMDEALTLAKAAPPAPRGPAHPPRAAAAER